MTERINWHRSKSRAREILRKLSIDEPPVPVERIAEELGAEVRYQPTEGEVSGFMFRGPDSRTVIGINSVHHLHRQRFTLAHEIGHLCLHDEQRIYIDRIRRFRDKTSSLATEPEEIEANTFAAELLMPEDFIIQDLQRIPREQSPDEISNYMAERYKVSSQAMAIRLGRLDPRFF